MDKLTMATYKYIPNYILNNDTLSTGGGGNRALFTNKNMKATSTTEMVTSIDMDDDNLFILITTIFRILDLTQSYK